MKKTCTLTITALLLAFQAWGQTVNISAERAEALSCPDTTFAAPQRSFVRGDGVIVDTLDTSDPRIKIVLRSDNTWEYVKDVNFFTDTDYFNENWNDNTNAYGIENSQLPEKIMLWLVDETSHFCCPYQTKVFSKFGIRHRRPHQGVDLPYPVGTPVRAAFDGKVRISRWASGYGNLVVIRHANGLETFYGHLSESKVSVGDWVSAGQVIALGGSTGRSTGPHLHFETRYKGHAFDPERIIDFEKGILRSGIFTIKKKYLSPYSNYIPETIDEEEEVYKEDEEKKAAEQKRIAEQQAIKYHTVKQGDTLSKIAARNGTTLSAILKLNPKIKETTKIQIGWKIRVK